MPKRIVIGICGASGVIYGIRLIRELLNHSIELHVIVSDAGRQVIAHELRTGGPLRDIVHNRYPGEVHPEAVLLEHDISSFFEAPASGSFRHDGMAIVPCSMKTAAAIASGYAENLIHRAADICLKERRKLVIVPRETPLGVIHLQNLLRLAEAGAVILPPAPGFYRHPRTIDDMIDFVVARILDQFHIPQTLVQEWESDHVGTPTF
ncbi:MAG: UbiX family flavin prenyltransferase [Thermodesulfobacteriota bacterium]